MRDLVLYLRWVLSSLLDLAFPPLCRACGDVMENASDLLCSSCHSSLTRITPADAVYDEALRKLRQGGLIHGLVSLYVFEKTGPLQALIHALKYDGAASVGTALGRRLGAMATESLGASADDLIVPIPLHRARLRERGYNQAELIAVGMSFACGAHVDAGLLMRCRNTISQTALSIHERKENVASAFGVRAGCRARWLGKRVFLVDDVITTGSTMRECARLVHENGARAVVSCSIALAARDANS
jgi:ComF family protein